MEPIIISALITAVTSIACALIAAHVASNRTAQKMTETVAVLENNVNQLERMISKLESKLELRIAENGELAKKVERLDVRLEAVEREVKELKHSA